MDLIRFGGQKLKIERATKRRASGHELKDEIDSLYICFVQNSQPKPLMTILSSRRHNTTDKSTPKLNPADQSQD